jgi:hypothetical protein
MTHGRANEGMFDDEEENVRRIIEESLMQYNYRVRVEKRVEGMIMVARAVALDWVTVNV